MPQKLAVVKWKLVKIQIAVKICSFGQKNVLSKVHFLRKNMLAGYFGLKSKFWLKIEILVKNRNFGQKSKF